MDWETKTPSSLLSGLDIRTRPNHAVQQHPQFGTQFYYVLQSHWKKYLIYYELLKFGSFPITVMCKDLRDEERLCYDIRCNMYPESSLIIYKKPKDGGPWIVLYYRNI